MTPAQMSAGLLLPGLAEIRKVAFSVALAGSAADCY
jgi:hypothetical protein